MAILKTEGKLELDLSFVGLDFDSYVQPPYKRKNIDWVYYSISMLFAGKFLLNPQIFDQLPAYKAMAPEGGFVGRELSGFSLFEVIENALTTDKEQVWEPVEPDAEIIFTPECKKENIRISIMIDSGRIRQDSENYTGTGPTFLLCVKQEALSEFATELKDEYETFIRKSINT